jgi:hypothetical protein
MALFATEGPSGQPVRRVLRCLRALGVVEASLTKSHEICVFTSADVSAEAPFVQSPTPVARDYMRASTYRLRGVAE